MKQARSVKHILLALTVALCSARSSFAQEESPLLPPQLRSDPRERMKELFVQVERRLGEIDQLLYRAGSGERPLESQRESGINDLLQQSKQGGEAVLKDIDELLELAKQMGGKGQPKPGSGQGQGQQQSQPSGQQGNEPQQGSQRPQEQERTPDAPSRENPQQGQGGDKPEPQPQPQPGEAQPKSDRDSKDAARNAQGTAPPSAAKGRNDGARSNEQWGDLPPTVRDLFRTEGGSDLPPQYRDWIDAYYRRLNQEKR